MLAFGGIGGAEADDSHDIARELARTLIRNRLFPYQC
jgi:hypothetical protein